jgi:hypothetical protein
MAKFLSKFFYKSLLNKHETAETRVYNDVLNIIKCFILAFYVR